MFRSRSVMAVALAPLFSGLLLRVPPARAASPEVFAAAGAAEKVWVQDPYATAETWTGREERRHHQLQLHQGMALATLGSMALATGLGMWSVAASPDRSLSRPVHVAIGGLTTGLYLATAGLTLTAPTGPEETTEGRWDSVDIHRTLAWGHALTMALTLFSGVGVLAGRTEEGPHGWAGKASLGLMALSAGVIVFAP